MLASTATCEGCTTSYANDDMHAVVLLTEQQQLLATMTAARITAAAAAATAAEAAPHGEHLPAKSAPCLDDDSMSFCTLDAAVGCGCWCR
jgi:hypothetical protein